MFDFDANQCYDYTSSKIEENIMLNVKSIGSLHMKTNYTKIVTSLPVYSDWLKKASDSIWKDSIFECFRNLNSPKTKGCQGEKVVKQFMEKLGHKVSDRLPKSENDTRKPSDYDCIINGIFVEVKTSSTWDKSLDNFTWQQIRDQPYDRIIFVGFNPNSVDFYWATKGDLKKHVFNKNKYRQHAGKDGNQELYWLQGIKNMPWFRDIKDF